MQQLGGHEQMDPISSEPLNRAISQQPHSTTNPFTLKILISPAPCGIYACGTRNSRRGKQHQQTPTNRHEKTLAKEEEKQQQQKYTKKAAAPAFLLLANLISVERQGRKRLAYVRVACASAFAPPKNHIFHPFHPLLAAATAAHAFSLAH